MAQKAIKRHNVKRGYNLPIAGKAEEVIEDAPRPNNISVRPAEFLYLKCKLHVKEGDSVKIGTPLFHDKKRPDILHASPAAGRVSEIVYGPRRIVERIVISPSGDEYEQFDTFRQGDISSLDRDRLRQNMLKGGVWPLVRQRPFDVPAGESATPSSIFVNCMSTGPLAAKPEFALKHKFAEFKAGVEALKVLAGGNPVHVIVPAGLPSDCFFFQAEGVEFHEVQGKHPAGLVSTHIERIDPITSPQKRVWYTTARGAVDIGSFLLLGQYPTERVIALAGNGVKRPRYLKTRVGADFHSYGSSELESGEQRIISGDVLTGRRIEVNDSIGLYDDLISVIPEDREQRFLGWMMPGFKNPTYSRAYMSGFLPIKRFQVTTSQNGEHRALVKTGDYRRVVALDILPEHLVKSILAEDVELMEQLGIMEVAPEDVALCSYICPSKTEFTEIVQQGLDLMYSELT